MNRRSASVKCIGFYNFFFFCMGWRLVFVPNRTAKCRGKCKRITLNWVEDSDAFMYFRMKHRKCERFCLDCKSKSILLSRLNNSSGLNNPDIQVHQCYFECIYTKKEFQLITQQNVHCMRCCLYIYVCLCRVFCMITIIIIVKMQFLFEKKSCMHVIVIFNDVSVEWFWPSVFEFPHLLIFLQFFFLFRFWMYMWSATKTFVISIN